MFYSPLPVFDCFFLPHFCVNHCFITLNQKRQTGSQTGWARKSELWWWAVIQGPKCKEKKEGKGKSKIKAKEKKQSWRQIGVHREQRRSAEDTQGSGSGTGLRKKDEPTKWKTKSQTKIHKDWGTNEHRGTQKKDRKTDKDMRWKVKPDTQWNNLQN